MICGYHEYNIACNNPVVGENLLCKCEVGIVSHGQTTFQHRCYCLQYKRLRMGAYTASNNAQHKKVVWPLETKVGNSHDTHAVAVKKVINGNLTVVGHIPQRISSICSIYFFEDILSVVKIIGRKTLADQVSSAKSANVFYHQSFVLYGIHTV